ncbi:hypothetical protein K457DRAFT_16362 [Linnemannia elongata AG-77]|uniref:Uncharacterized protein n=1 Tax=Linnemannia elongata AG-77 TaxID=1314771 RepID=A0A197K4F0_9FUNG|nr:hypothetical protein K457DRAFT_16362 [Linnemannia elongata AG-77]
MKITTVLTVLAAIVVVQAVPISSIPHGESITLSSNIQVMEKRAPFVRPNSDLSGEHYIKRSDDKHDRKKRTFESVGTRRSPSFSPSGSFGSGVSGDLKKRRELSSSASNISRTFKRSGGYNPSNPQGGEGGVYGDGGGDLKKRSSTMSDTFRKREGGLDPVDPFANVAKGDADLK